MRFYPTVIFATDVASALPARANEMGADLEGFRFSIPADWKKVGKESEFVDQDGFISPKAFDLNGKKMPVTVTARRMERDAGLTEKNIEERSREFVKEAMRTARVHLAAPGCAGPKVLGADLAACGFTTRKVGKQSIYTSTFIVAGKGSSDESLVTKCTAVSYIDGDHLCVLMLVGVLQHYREHEQQIRKIAASAKPGR